MEQEEKHTKFYSQTAIAVATFFGAPLAAGVLIRKNCIGFGRDKQGLYALIIGIVFTIILFAGIFSLPEKTIDKIPNFLIPFIYTIIIYFIVEKMQGKELKKLRKENGDFYSNWRAAGIGTICLAIILSIIFIFVLSTSEKWEKPYDEEMEVFYQNQEESMFLFDMLDNKDTEEIVLFIDKTGLPKWKENIDIIQRTNNIEDLPDNIKEYNKLILEYCHLRVETYELIKNMLLKGKFDYNSPELMIKQNQIDKILDKLNE